MTTPHPFGQRVTAQPSPVDAQEEQLPSGLIVQRDTKGGDVHRGIVLEIAEMAQLVGCPFDTGDLIYYSQADNIGDIDVVPIGNILAWE